MKFDMSYELNRKEYKKNLMIGASASFLFHFLIIIPLLINGGEVIQFKEGYVNLSMTNIDVKEIKVENYEILKEGGGGGGGGGTDQNGGGAMGETKSGIPVPSAEPQKAEFDVITYVPPDSADKNQGLKVGMGFGTGEGTGSGSGSGTGIGSGKGSGIGSGTGDGTTTLSFTPRQILEVIPEKRSGFNGIIKLSVRIGKDGCVKNHKILQNTTGSDIGLSKVLEAVYKSRWQSIKVEGKMVEYWTEKTYKFE